MGGGGTVAQAPAQPPPRDLGKEYKDMLQAQVDLAPQIYASESQYRPQYARLDLNILKDIMLNDGVLDLYEKELTPRLSKLDSMASNLQRTADISDVESLGGRAREAFRALNPENTARLKQLSDMAENVGPSDIEKELTRQSLEDLKLGRNLSQSEIEDANQAARAGMSARGMVLGKPALAMEILNRDDVARNRLNERRNNAMTAETLFQQRQSGDRSFVGNVVNTTQSNVIDPFMMILGRPSRAVDQSQSMFNQSMPFTDTQNKMFGMNQSQFSQYASQLNSDNFEQANNFAIAQANASSANKAGAAGQKGQLIGAGIGAVAMIGMAA